MTLRDVYCVECNNTIVDYWCDTSDVSACSILCEHCERHTPHRPVCNGGTRSRWRYADFPSWHEDPDFYRGQTAHKVGVYEYDDDGNEVTTVDLDGDAIESRPRFADPDIQAERRDRAEHKIKAQVGKTPITIDQKAV